MILFILVFSFVVSVTGPLLCIIVLNGELCGLIRCNIVHKVTHVMDHRLEHRFLLCLVLDAQIRIAGLFHHGSGILVFLYKFVLQGSSSTHSVQLLQFSILYTGLNVLNLIERELV